MTYRIAFIGLGAIGQDVLAELTPLLLEMNAEVLVLRRSPSHSTSATYPNLRHCSDLTELLSHKPQLVIEIASQEAVKEYVPACIRNGSDVIISSVGALADLSFFSELKQLAKEHNTQLMMPSGAIAGLDYLQAVGHAPDISVIYESLKPVKAWAQELEALGVSASELNEPFVLFEGSADEAAKRYPKNLNVAATLALAGAGMEATKVKVIIDPALKRNKHVIRVSSVFGDMKIEITNKPSPTNPKSSWIVAQSISAVVRRQFTPLKIS